MVPAPSTIGAGPSIGACACLRREFSGEPDAGNPHLRFDEGRVRHSHGLSLPLLLYRLRSEPRASASGFRAELYLAVSALVACRLRYCAAGRCVLRKYYADCFTEVARPSPRPTRQRGKGEAGHEILARTGEPGEGAGQAIASQRSLVLRPRGRSRRHSERPARGSCRQSKTHGRFWPVKRGPGLLDTGPLVSFLASGLRHHAWSSYRM